MGRGPPVAEEQGPYEIEPADEPERGPKKQPEPEPPPAEEHSGGERAERAASGQPERAGPKPRIEAESLLEGFDENADFERDPEVEAALGHDKPAKPDLSEDAALADPSRWIIRPGFPGTRTCLIAAGTLTIAAVVFSIINAENRWWLHALESLYGIALHTLLGLFAVVTAAYFAERGVNEIPLALARIAAPTAGAGLVLSLDIPIPTRTDEMLLAGLAYYLLVMVCFRLPRFETNILAISHFGLWLLVRLGVELGIRAGAV